MWIAGITSWGFEDDALRMFPRRAPLDRRHPSEKRVLHFVQDDKLCLGFAMC